MEEIKIHHTIIKSLLTDLLNIYYYKELDKEMTSQEFLKKIVKQMHSQLTKELAEREED